LVSGVSKLVDMAGALDKPSTTQTAMPIFFDTDADMQYSSGLDYARKLTMHPSSQTSVSPLIMYGPSNPTLKEVIQKPAWIGAASFNSSNVENDPLYTLTLHPGLVFKQTNGTKTIYSPTPLAWYGSMFGTWRGGMKLFLHFNTSSFTTTRVRITHVQADVFNPAPLADQSGDYTSKIVDITGDVMVPIHVPYLDPKSFLNFDWAAVQDGIPPDNLGNITVTLVNPVVTPDSTASSAVWINAFIAAAEDFEFYQFCGPRAPLSSTWTPVWGSSLPSSDKPVPEDVTQQCSIGAEFKKPFPGLTPTTMSKKVGFITEDAPTHILDLAKHYYRYDTAYGTGFKYSLPIVQSNPSLLTLILAPFLFIRGSTRFKYLAKSTTATGLISPFVPGGSVLQTSDSAASGGIWLGSLWNKPIASVEVPFFQAYPYYELSPTHFDIGEYPPFATSFASTDVQNTFISVGDDFSVGYQCAVPCMSFTTPGPGKNAASKKQRTV